MSEISRVYYLKVNFNFEYYKFRGEASDSPWLVFSFSDISI